MTVNLTPTGAGTLGNSGTVFVGGLFSKSATATPVTVNTFKVAGTPPSVTVVAGQPAILSDHAHASTDLLREHLVDLLGGTAGWKSRSYLLVFNDAGHAAGHKPLAGHAHHQHHAENHYDG